MRTMAWHSGWRFGRGASPRRRRPFVFPRAVGRRAPDPGSRRRAGETTRRRTGQAGARRRRGLPLLIGCLLIVALALAGVDYAVTPVIEAWAEQYGRNMAQHAIAAATQDVFRGDGAAARLSHIEETGDGKLIVMPEWGRINSLAAELELGIQQRLDQLVAEQSPVPFGQVLGLHFLAGFGPPIQVRVLSTGALETTLESVLREAGINQTLHSIYLRVESTVKILVPTVTEEIKLTTRLPVSETMLVGDVPEWYMTGSGSLEELPLGAVPLRAERDNSASLDNG